MRLKFVSFIDLKWSKTSACISCCIQPRIMRDASVICLQRIACEIILDFYLMSPVDFDIGYNNYILSQGLQAQYNFSNYLSFWLIFIPNLMACQRFIRSTYTTFSLRKRKQIWLLLNKETMLWNEIELENVKKLNFNTLKIF